MVLYNKVNSQKMKVIKETNYRFEGQTGFYRGKVRDVYRIKDRFLIMVATDRISAFDVVLPKPIPYKGQVLNQLAAKFLKETEDIVPNWVITVPDPMVTIGYACEPIKVEMVIRGYLSGYAWRAYKEGVRSFGGVSLGEGLKENDELSVPIITPTTKAVEGHDEDISKEEIIQKGIVSSEDYKQIELYTRLLYQRGVEIAKKRGLILVDAKYEFGKRDGIIYLIDEIHTPDCSRYFYLKGYNERQLNGEPQQQLSKEFVRQWLMENGFQGKEDQEVPEMSSAKVKEISKRYVELFEHITGEEFLYPESDAILSRIESNINSVLSSLKEK